MKPVATRYDFASAALLLILVYAFVVNAWVVDDAYITFRVIDNLLHGYGLVWNVGERVQAYTHPLWLFVVALFASVTHELFFTSLAVSFGLFVTSIVVVAWSLRTVDAWRPALWIAAVLGSKAIIDFSSSGLENALSDFLAALFFSAFLNGPRGFFAPFFIASLAFVNRQDTVLLYVPALCYLIYTRWPPGRALWRAAAAGMLPAVVWLAFSLFYYGWPAPNTGYAKLVSTGVAQFDRLHHGVYYFLNSINWDWGSYALVALAAISVWRAKRAAPLFAMAGVALYLGYVAFDASIATHMSGRFFSLPFFVALLVLAATLPARFAPAAAGVILLSVVFNPFSPIKANTRFYPPPMAYHDIIDTRRYVADEGASLLEVLRTGGELQHPWLAAGRRFRDEPAHVRVGAAGIAPLAVGFFGYAAGPDKYVVDVLGLTDPLLAHVIACNSHSIAEWTPGHFFRDIPDGYLASLHLSVNLIRDPDLHEYYDKLMVVTRGRLFERERLLTIVRLNTGAYDGQLQRFNERARGVSWKTCQGRVVALLGTQQ